MERTEYARVGGLHVAYQRFGTGATDVVLISDWFGHVEQMWEGAAFARALLRLGSFARVLVFDKRGVGLSDPLPGAMERGLPPIEEWIADVEAVMDDAEVKSATLIGVGSGGPMVLQFAATYPHRVDAVVLVNSYARLARADDYPVGVPEHVRDAVLARSYTDDSSAAALLGGSAGEATRSWWQRYQRQSVSPGVAAAMRAMMFDIDVRAVLDAVHAPTLVLHRVGDPWIRIGHGRYLADHLPAARLVELPGDEDLFFVGDVDELLDEIEQFVTDAPPASTTDRMLLTLLFTDIVDSTATAAEIGDARWRLLLDDHDRASRLAVERHRGRIVKATGDGILATFDGPGRAVRCAQEIDGRVSALGIQVRAGVHTGEVEVRGDDVSGIAVAIASRVAGLAGGGEVLTTAAVRDLVAGSGFRFTSRGHHELKGVPGPWEVLAVGGA